MDLALKIKFKKGMILFFLVIFIHGVVVTVFYRFFFINDTAFIGGIVFMLISLIGLILSILEKLPILKEVQSAQKFIVFMIMWYPLAILTTLGQIFNPTFPLLFILAFPWIFAGFSTYFFYVITYTKTS